MRRTEAKELPSPSASSQTSDDKLPPDVRRFARQVREHRGRKAWSQSTLAETAGVNVDVIQRLESGAVDPPASLVFKLTRILDLALNVAVYNRVIGRRVETAQTPGGGG